MLECISTLLTFVLGIHFRMCVNCSRHLDMFDTCFWNTFWNVCVNHLTHYDIFDICCWDTVWNVREDSMHLDMFDICFWNIFWNVCVIYSRHFDMFDTCFGNTFWNACESFNALRHCWHLLLGYLLECVWRFKASRYVWHLFLEYILECVRILQCILTLFTFIFWNTFWNVNHSRHFDMLDICLWPLTGLKVKNVETLEEIWDFQAISTSVLFASGASST